MLDVGGIDAIVGMQAHGHVARLARRVDPVAHFHAGEGDAQRLRGVAHGDAEGIREAAVQVDLELVLRLLFGEPNVDRAGNGLHLLHEIAGDGE